MSLLPGTTLGPYTIVGPLGAGGMGEVYRAHDGRLGRDVAIKVLPALVSHDPERRARLQREARAIAALNHPHICVIHDVGEQEGLDFIVMELLDGESLAARLARGPIRFSEAAPIARAILETLAAVHARGLLHRDLKPANIFLTQHGVKLLDFGLARSAEPDQGATTAITREGLVLGSPRYMAPEQIRGAHLDHRTDLFAAAVIMHEMLTGVPAFNGSSPIEVAHAIAYEEPAPLQPDAAPPAFQRALRQALEKDPARRPQSAQAFAAALSADSTTTGPREAIAPPGRRTTRVIVVPFRLLRPDPDIDFLGFSLADAVASSLAGFDSLVVRSSLGVVQASPTTDLRALAQQADVDVALLGSLLRVGAQVRVSAQLVEVPGGSILWSRTMQAPVEDLFQLQDTLAHAIVSSLHVPLTAREEGRLRQDVPANAEAYELYLRANQLMTETGRWPEARELYDRAVALDPGYAPAWARLGRVLRVSAKYGGPEPEVDRVRAERAFERALALNPDLPMAHHFYTHLEVELGRAADAMVRLLTRARARRPEADVFAGLVTTCRYCGLLDESVAAYEQAKRIDPSVATSVSYTFYLLGDYARTRETDADLHGFPSMLARHRSGDSVGAITSLKALEGGAPYALGRTIAAAYRAALEREPQAAREQLRLLEASTFRDPEGLFLLGGFLAAAGISDAALVALDRGVTGGFICPRAMRSDPSFDGIRNTPEFGRLQALADSAHLRARDAFDRAGGPQLLRSIG